MAAASSLLSTPNLELSVVSLNMDGFRQGREMLDRICSVILPQVVFIQEHWKSPGDLSEV